MYVQLLLLLQTKENICISRVTTSGKLMPYTSGVGNNLRVGGPDKVRNPSIVG